MQSYIKAIPSQNPLVTEKIYQRSAEQHRRKLRNIKSSVDTKPPRHYKARPARNLKKEQMKQERHASIDRENRLLLEKMAKIMHDDHELSLKATSAKRAKAPRSLNIEYRQREMKRITRQNMQILERLQKSEPTYNVLKWEVEHKEHQALMRSIVQQRPRPKTTRGKKSRGMPGSLSSKDLSLSRPATREVVSSVSMPVLRPVTAPVAGDVASGDKSAGGDRAAAETKAGEPSRAEAGPDDAVDESKVAEHRHK